MSAFGRGRVRTLLAPWLGAAGVAFAAGLAFADPRSPLGPSAGNLGAGVLVLSPETPLKFGDLADASPLFAVLTAGQVGGGDRKSVV